MAVVEAKDGGANPLLDVGEAGTPSPRRYMYSTNRRVHHTKGVPSFYQW